MLMSRNLVVDKGYDPFRFSPSDRSPGIIRPRRTPVLSTIFFLAESIGIEPIHRLPSDGLANRCLSRSANSPLPCKLALQY